jgi:hypothetical protein
MPAFAISEVEIAIRHWFAGWYLWRVRLIRTVCSRRTFIPPDNGINMIMEDK